MAIKGKGPGRPKGSVNKVTADIRTMIEGALSAKGGQKYLEKQAEANPVAFMGLVGKCLPKDVIIDVTNRTVSELTDDQLFERLKRARSIGRAVEAAAGQKEPSPVH
jgi:hypothetical protein